MLLSRPCLLAASLFRVLVDGGLGWFWSWFLLDWSGPVWFTSGLVWIWFWSVLVHLLLGLVIQ
ncbi:uncharacterized protein B0T15DRAFT_528173 [Chaetomium strumarium]|uniref:Uncharacterized protein n=1 Tax=Chaetomium strumarium TaxID=1170767 RepID=A0AAJ0GV83_9PEZI|nr:hypothetical protein B0T15DRAFT_528173 [Chaetomium strumarium]